MDNKLSELSKPVAQIYYDEHDSSVMRIGWLRSDEPKNPESLYSQEYVSALLAEIGVRERSLISNCVDYEYDLIEMKRRAEAAEQRVAELEQAMKEQSNG